MHRLLGWLALLLLCPVVPAGAADLSLNEVLLGDIERRYETLTTGPAASERFVVAVDLDGDNLALTHDAAAGRLSVRYRMNFNQVAEGWSWQPQANPADTDYYRYKFLPLGSRERQQGAPYVQEDLPGRTREVKRIWHFDYFLAFDNPYDFFARPTLDDDAGFVGEIAVTAAQAQEFMKPGRLALLAWAHWQTPKYAESTTFWKATDGKPVDLTLKNRYLIGKLDELWIVDNADARVLAKLGPRAAAVAAGR